MAQSARGLFRATGKTTNPAAALDAGGAIVKAAQLEREQADFYPTPPEPTRALLRAEGDRLADFPHIWEPAAGDGAMMREIEAAGFKCHGTELHERGGLGVDSGKDFFSFTEPMHELRAIVTNPPYNQVNYRDGRGRWITHAMDVLEIEYMALLLSWSWPGASGLGGVWAKWPPARVYLMRWKIDFTGAGAPPMLNAWFCWDRAWKGETVLRMLNRDQDARQAEMFLRGEDNA